MKVIGITGNIGCGKSTVAGMLRALGVVTIDADDVSREVRETDPRVRASILERFGTLDSAALAARVFADADERTALEAIVHPAVRRAVDARLAELAAAGTEVAAVEAIKLLESPVRDRCDAIWTVICDETDAVERVARNRGLTEADVRARLSNQTPQTGKAAASDTVINGSATLDETEREVRAAFARLLPLAG